MRVVSSYVVIAAFATMLVAVPSARGESGDEAAQQSQAPQPWKTGKTYRPTLEQYIATMDWWAATYPQWVDVEVRERSLEGDPIYLVKITDKSIPDDDKAVCLITALHTGAERTGGTGNLHVIDWLLSDDALAAEVRRKQVVLVMPIVNPYAFFVREVTGNSAFIDPYSAGRGREWDQTTLELKRPEKTPETVAFKSVVDEYHPEVHADNHGVAMHFPGHLVFETTGTAYSNYTLRPWDWRVTERVIAGAAEAGFGSDRAEADAQRAFWGPTLDAIADQLWFGRPYFYTAHYAYTKYHTLPIASEIGWEASCVARMKALLTIGNERWLTEPHVGYPVNTIKSVGPYQVVAWGTTASQRRTSRVELWQRQASMALGMLYAETDCRASLMCAVTDRAAAVMWPDPKAYATPNAQFLEALSQWPGVDFDAVRTFVEAGPERRIMHPILSSAGGPLRRDGATEPVRNGLALRLRIAYPDPELVDLRLNGHPIEPGETDGYQRWYADGYTHVQVNIPPERTQQQELFIVTCAYQPKQMRSYGWRPPPQVMQLLKRQEGE